MIDFTGVDILVQHRPDDGVIRDSLSKVLLVSTPRVAVIDNIADYPERETADVVCVVSPAAGEFAAVLSIQSTPRAVPQNTLVEVTKQLASALRVSCLVPIEGVDPYLMWLVPPDLPPIRVALEPEALGEERYIVAPRL